MTAFAETAAGSISARAGLRDHAGVGDKARTDNHARALQRMRFVVGWWQAMLATAMVAATLLVWPAVDGLSGAEVRRLGGSGIHLDVTVTSAAMLLGLVGGVAGSLVHSTLIFSHRAGRETLETGYLSWYLLRPFAAGLLAMIFVAGVHSGFVTVSASTATSPVLAYLAGGLAGLFTDAVIQRLRHALGATNPDVEASKQEIPLGAPVVLKHD